MNTGSMTPEPDDATDFTPRPWERQLRESAPAWAAFQRYRDLGLRRTLDAVNHDPVPPAAPSERRGRAKRRRNGSVSSWSRQHDWVSRAAAWDAEVDAQARLAQIEAVREMSARHARAARELQARALQALQTLSPTDMAAADILRFMIEAAKLERLALGEVTSRTANEVSGGSAPLVIEVVERLVPIRGDDRPVPSPTTVRVFEGAAPDPVHEEERDGDPAEFDLPAEPPPFLRRA